MARRNVVCVGLSEATSTWKVQLLQNSSSHHPQVSTYTCFAEPRPDANNLMAFNQIFAWKRTWNGAHGSLLRLSWNSIYLNFVAKYRKMVIDILQL